jgi:bis(5'-nucleosidyl)-tetraphosphatase
MKMQNDQSYGLIPIHKETYLVIHHTAGHWGFPKGHPEQNEDAISAAKRELKEETGLTAQTIIEKHRFKETYEITKNNAVVMKTVDYYIAFIEDTRLNLGLNEIQEAEWLTFDEAYNRLSFAGTKTILLHTADWLNQNKSV